MPELLEKESPFKRRKKEHLQQIKIFVEFLDLRLLLLLTKIN